ncbi:plasmid recombination enzyme [Bordetella hinzii 5132]|uniref:MobV family relaxase n=1 Tax=Bordetella hinzii TaxID=103855 RepID=UPI00045B0B4C|nr:MobV family relaxase [Bordetella hinzii]KCB43813.1 plasmid recombination enzyme [Bordetella hinzii 5132]
MNYNILRTEKVKSRSQITEAAEHNFRLRTQHNIDGSRSNMNEILVNTLGVDTKKSSSLQEKLTEYYSNLGIKEKKENVLMMEFIVSASPEFFTGKSKSDIDKWAKHQVDFFKNEFGEQLKIAVLHLDEKTPHLHFMIGTEIESVKKYKNQKGEFHKKTWSLNAKRYNPEFLRELHDRHAQHNKVFGLRRGVKGSMREHKTLKEFYQMVDKALNSDYGKTIEKAIDSLETGLLSGKVSIEQVREKFKPVINGVLKQNKALREKYSLELKMWAEEISELKEKLETEKIELAARRELYADAINEKQQHIKIIKEQEDEISQLRAEVEKFNQKQNKSIKYKGDKNGLHI